MQVTDVQELDDSGKGAGIPTFSPDSDDPILSFRRAGGWHVSGPDSRSVRRLARRSAAGLCPRDSQGRHLISAWSRCRPHHANLTAPADSQPGNPLLRRGGTEMINVVALRRDNFDGEIALTVEGLPPGVTASKGSSLPARTRQPWCCAAADEQPASAGPIRIVGKATVDGKESPARHARLRRSGPRP